MDNTLLLWNVRGLNSVLKQQEVSVLCKKNKCGLVALFETKLNKAALLTCYKKWFPQWHSLDNTPSIGKGRILFLWRQDEFQVQLLAMEPQFIHVKVEVKATLQSVYLTVIYASNEQTERLQLWDSLRTLTVSNVWLVGGDFNNVLRPTEREGGQIPMVTEYEPFAECLCDCALADMRGRAEFLHGQIILFAPRSTVFWLIVSGWWSSLMLKLNIWLNTYQTIP